MSSYDYYLEKALNSSNQSGKSALVEEYENAIINFFNVENAIAVNSGSSALQTALHAVGAKAGKKVIVSATAPLPTLMPISATGAEIVFVDSLPDSPNINPEALEIEIDPNVVAVIEVSLWGYLQDYKALLAILNKFNLPLIEDAAHSHGSFANDKYAGTIGTIGCFSTHQKKLLSTGEGGFIITNSSALTNRMRQFIRIGNLDGKNLGMNFKISAFTAAIGLARLSEFQTILYTRNNSRLELLEFLIPHGFKELTHVGTPNGYNLVLDIGKIPSEKLLNSLKESGIELDVLKYNYKCGYKHPLFLNTFKRCENAELLIPRLIQLPTDLCDNKTLSQKFINLFKADIE